MRYILIFIGAAVVAYFLTMGIQTYLSERKKHEHPKDGADE